MKSSSILIIGLCLWIPGCDHESLTGNKANVSHATDLPADEKVINYWVSLEKPLQEYSKANPDRPIIVSFGADW